MKNRVDIRTLLKQEEKFYDKLLKDKKDEVVKIKELPAPGDRLVELGKICLDQKLIEDAKTCFKMATQLGSVDAYYYRALYEYKDNAQARDAALGIACHLSSNKDITGTSWKELDEKKSPQTRAILLSSFLTSYSLDDFKAVDEAFDTDLETVADESYDDLHELLPSIPELEERKGQLFDYSKIALDLENKIKEKIEELNQFKKAQAESSNKVKNLEAQSTLEKKHTLENVKGFLSRLGKESLEEELETHKRKKQQAKKNVEFLSAVISDLYFYQALTKKKLGTPGGLTDAGHALRQSYHYMANSSYWGLTPVYLLKNLTKELVATQNKGSISKHINDLLECIREESARTDGYTALLIHLMNSLIEIARSKLMQDEKFAVDFAKALDNGLYHTVSSTQKDMKYLTSLLLTALKENEHIKPFKELDTSYADSLANLYFAAENYDHLQIQLRAYVCDSAKKQKSLLEMKEPAVDSETKRADKPARETTDTEQLAKDKWVASLLAVGNDHMQTAEETKNPHFSAARSLGGVDALIEIIIHRRKSPKHTDKNEAARLLLEAVKEVIEAKPSNKPDNKEKALFKKRLSLIWQEATALSQLLESENEHQKQFAEKLTGLITHVLQHWPQETFMPLINEMQTHIIKTIDVALGIQLTYVSDAQFTLANKIDFLRKIPRSAKTDDAKEKRIEDLEFFKLAISASAGLSNILSYPNSSTEVKEYEKQEYKNVIEEWFKKGGSVAEISKLKPAAREVLFKTLIKKLAEIPTKHFLRSITKGMLQCWIEPLNPIGAMLYYEYTKVAFHSNPTSRQALTNYRFATSMALLSSRAATTDAEMNIIKRDYVGGMFDDSVFMYREALSASLDNIERNTIPKEEKTIIEAIRDRELLWDFISSNQSDQIKKYIQADYPVAIHHAAKKEAKDSLAQTSSPKEAKKIHNAALRAICLYTKVLAVIANKEFITDYYCLTPRIIENIYTDAFNFLSEWANWRESADKISEEDQHLRDFAKWSLKQFTSNPEIQQFAKKRLVKADGLIEALLTPDPTDAQETTQNRILLNVYKIGIGQIYNFKAETQSVKIALQFFSPKKEEAAAPGSAAAAYEQKAQGGEQTGGLLPVAARSAGAAGETEEELRKRTEESQRTMLMIGALHY